MIGVQRGFETSKPSKSGISAWPLGPGIPKACVYKRERERVTDRAIMITRQIHSYIDTYKSHEKAYRD